MSRTILLLFLTSIGLLAETLSPSIRYTGSPADGNGQNCSACHSGGNAGITGSLAVTVDDYTPGVQQLIHIRVDDSMASIWGFQMTIREVTDPTKEAGTFTASPGIQVRCDDGSRFGSVAPCAPGTREFAEHDNAPRTGGGAGFVWDVAWSPPANEVGRIEVFVAAVAGNSDGTPGGDRVYTFTKSLNAIGGCSVPEKKPTLQTIVNAGSLKAPFSANSMIAIFGLGFQVSGRTRTAGLGDFVNNAFPTVLGCVAVEVTGPGIPQPVRLPISYVQQDQINAQAPNFSGAGSVQLTVILNAGKPNELRSDVATVNTQDFAPAFFLFLPSQSIAAQLAGTATIIASPTLVPGARPARPGEIVTLYGTGFGTTDPPVAPGALDPGLSTVTHPVTVTIGGTTLAATDVFYAGLSPGSISGLYQFNVRIPASTPDGDIPVTIAVGGSQTQAGATIPVQH